MFLFIATEFTRNSLFRTVIRTTSPTMSNMSSQQQTTTTLATPPTITINSDSSDVEEFVDAYETTVTPTEALYNANNCKLRYLVLLCNDDLLDINRTPFTLLRRKQSKPSAEMLKAEVVRRYKSTNPAGLTLGPRPKHWTLDQLHKWLADHPIQSKKDVAF
jgi:hypothetical protein